ncbi:hypothetical protein CEE44_00565 [Candidatus Woesearchaeota archaeon B3_Woes]|nr:MAG: hypothetical protein CEE44_00565 [Candidatus Woesearchaeota archaeon B3_Woes]
MFAVRKFYKKVMGAKIGLSAQQLKLVLSLIKLNKIHTKEKLIAMLEWFRDEYSEKTLAKKNDPYHESYDKARKEEVQPIIDLIMVKLED